MIIRRLNNKDQEPLDRFLVNHTESSMFIRSNMKRADLEYQDRNYHGEYIGALDESENFVGVIALYWNGNIMMQAPDKDVLDSLAAHFHNNISNPIKGVLGPGDQAEFIIQKFGLSSAKYLMNDQSGLYTLDLKEMTKPQNFEFERSQIAPLNDVDRNIVTIWIRSFMIEALREEEGPGLDNKVEKRVARTLKEKTFSALLFDGKPVSINGYNATLKEAVQVGSVYTPPEYRKCGFARALLYLSLKQAQENGVEKAVLFAHDTAAVKAYEAIGFKRVGTYRLARLREPVSLS
jgi:GNAT superfamily N-acetyltransferase